MESFALPLVNFSRKNNLSLSAGTFAVIIASNAVMKAGYSNGFPEKIGGSLTGR